jgi:hypothetical protein
MNRPSNDTWMKPARLMPDDRYQAGTDMVDFQQSIHPGT